MKLYSWNVNGIRAVWNKGALQSFVAKHDPDILCLQETKAEQTQTTINLPWYREYWYSAAKKGYSGTAIFTKTEPLRVMHGFPDDIITAHDVTGDAFGNPNDEGRVLTAEFDWFFVVTVYTPNAKRDLGRLELRHKHWDPAFLAYLRQLEQTKPVLASGDFNVAHMPDDLANPGANTKTHGFTAEERAGFDNLVHSGFVDTFRKFTPNGNGHYTWWTHWANARTRNVGWRIDYWLASRAAADMVTGAQIHADVMGSDHCPISITVAT